MKDADGNLVTVTADGSDEITFETIEGQTYTIAFEPEGVGFANVSWHVDRAESIGEITGATAAQVRQHVAEAEHLAESPAADRAVVAQLDNAARKAEASAELVDAIGALADTFR